MELLNDTRICDGKQLQASAVVLLLLFELFDGLGMDSSPSLQLLESGPELVVDLVEFSLAFV